jgi:hypothetical protein
MRYAVLILALLGVAATGYIGFVWYQDVQEHGKITELGGALAGKGPEVKAMVDNRRLAAFGLMGASVLGLVGGILAFVRTKYIPAVLLILPAGVPGYFSTKAIHDDPKRVALLVSPLLLAGLLSFAIRTKPKTASAKGGAAEEEEEQPQRSGKKASMEVKNVAKKPEKKAAHTATDEDAEAAFAALEMEGAEAKAAPAKHDTSPEAEDIDLEAAAPEEEEPKAAEPAVAEEEKQVDLEAAAAREEDDRVNLETAAASEEDEKVDLESAAAPEEEVPDHEPAEPAAEAEEEEVESTAALYEEEEAAAPAWIDRFVCPSCDTYLKSSAPLPVGKPFNCPKCHEPVAVTARV